MIYLFLSIITSTFFGICFKLLERWRINSFQTIVFNYFMAASLGFVTTASDIGITEIPFQRWSLLGAFLGFIFIGSLYVIALTTQTMGITVAQVANKMSLIIPVTAAVLLYGDTITIWKIAGIILAVIAVFCVSNKESEISSSGKINRKLFTLPVIIFLCSGAIDLCINYAQVYYLTKDDFEVFLSSIFGTAGIIGSIWMMYNIIYRDDRIDKKSIPAGLVLGAINFCTMFFIIKALNAGILEASVLYPINNMCVLALSSLIAYFIFREKLSRINWLGIVLSILSILLIAFSYLFVFFS